MDLWELRYKALKEEITDSRIIENAERMATAAINTARATGETPEHVADLIFRISHDMKLRGLPDSIKARDVLHVNRPKPYHRHHG